MATIGMSKFLIPTFTKTVSGKRSSYPETEFGFGGIEEFVERTTPVAGLSFFQMKQMYFANTWVRSCVDVITLKCNDISPLVKKVSGVTDKNEQSKELAKKHQDTVEKWMLYP